MDDAFLALSLVSVAVLVATLIRPSLLRFSSRKSALLYVGSAAILFFILFGITADTTPSQSIEESTPMPPPPPSNIISIGEEGYLRIKDSTDQEQVLFLAPTPEIWEEVIKTFSARDTVGLLELASKDVFGVSNGTKVLVIDKQGFVSMLYRVRIIQGVRPIDEDKIGRSGWISGDFVSK